MPSPLLGEGFLQVKTQLTRRETPQEAIVATAKGIFRGVKSKALNGGKQDSKEETSPERPQTKEITYVTMVDRFCQMHGRKLSIYAQREDAEREAPALNTEKLNYFCKWEDPEFLRPEASYGLELRFDSGKALYVAAALDPESEPAKILKRARHKERARLRRMEEDKDKRRRDKKQKRKLEYDAKLQREREEQERILKMTPLERQQELGILDDETLKILEARRKRRARKVQQNEERVTRATYERRLRDAVGGKIDNVEPLNPRLTDYVQKTKLVIPPAGSAPPLPVDSPPKPRSRKSKAKSSPSPPLPPDSPSQAMHPQIFAVNKRKANKYRGGALQGGFTDSEDEEQSDSDFSTDNEIRSRKSSIPPPPPPLSTRSAASSRSSFPPPPPLPNEAPPLPTEPNNGPHVAPPFARPVFATDLVNAVRKREGGADAAARPASAKSRSSASSLRLSSEGRNLFNANMSSNGEAKSKANRTESRPTTAHTQTTKSRRAKGLFESSDDDDNGHEGSSSDWDDDSETEPDDTEDNLGFSSKAPAPTSSSRPSAPPPAGGKSALLSEILAAGRRGATKAPSAASTTQQKGTKSRSVFDDEDDSESSDASGSLFKPRPPTNKEQAIAPQERRVPPPLPFGGAGRGNLLAEIRKGAKLAHASPRPEIQPQDFGRVRSDSQSRSIAPPPPPAPPKAPPAVGGITADMLKMALASRTTDKQLPNGNVAASPPFMDASELKPRKKERLLSGLLRPPPPPPSTDSRESARIAGESRVSISRQNSSRERTSSTRSIRSVQSQGRPSIELTRPLAVPMGSSSTDTSETSSIRSMRSSGGSRKNVFEANGHGPTQMTVADSRRRPPSSGRLNLWGMPAEPTQLQHPIGNGESADRQPQELQRPIESARPALIPLLEPTKTIDAAPVTATGGIGGAIAAAMAAREIPASKRPDTDESDSESEDWS